MILRNTYLNSLNGKVENINQINILFKSQFKENKKIKGSKVQFKEKGKLVTK